jgi:hypothetical protein
VNVCFHPRGFAEVDAIMRYYEDVADSRLADDFYEEFRGKVLEVAEKPEHFNERAAVTSGRTCRGSPTIFFSARPVPTFGFWSSATTRAIPDMVPCENSDPLAKRLNPEYHRFSNSRFCLSSLRLSAPAGGFGAGGTVLRA